jgi:superfamily II DNA or RNA helicase
VGSFDEIQRLIKGNFSTADPVVEEFYVPLLSRSKKYDRVAGYFTSQGLALAGRGLSEFIQGGGSMRLIVGAQLEQSDVDAIERGEDLAEVVARRLASHDLWTELDDIEHHRLHVLAWLAREQRLEIRVGIQSKLDGTLMPASKTTEYFHDKFGIFTDENQQRVSFIGSNNDSKHGWMGNSESFAVFPEWLREVWEWSGIQLVDRFEKYWKNEHSAGWKIVPLADAVRDDLLRVAEFDTPPPTQDPELAPPLPPRSLLNATTAVSKLLAIPKHRPFTGVTSAGVEPLPHQRSVIDRAVRSFPRGYLFGDEVGLGKTIEVGLVLRELTLSGQAERSLVLVPAAVLSQWQEEMWEKIGLWVPRWDSGQWVWPDGSETASSSGDPWTSAAPIVLASSHLARTRNHRRQLISAAPWDVVVVDEAHHARRKGGKAEGQPNTLLELLQNLRDADGWKALFLASATPMQMYPHEAWDLIELFGLPGRWADDASQFESYFRELSVDWPARQWTFLARMVTDHFSDAQTEPNEHLDRSLVEELGKHPQRQLFLKGVTEKHVVIQDKMARRVGSDIQANKQWQQAVGADDHLASLASAWLYANNPMRDRVFRNTRDTLRAYRDDGQWPESATIPDRLVDDRAVDLSQQEQDLYCRVQEYIRTSYNKAQEIGDGQKRNALGFILTVYRRRLTSSFYAIGQSLRRRVEILDGQRDPETLLTLDDTVQELEPEPSVAAALKEWALDDEIHTLRKLAVDIGVIAAGDETKMHELHKLVDDALAGGHQTVLVFTQYADTMRYVRDRLNAIYQGRVIGYSADGGSIQNTTTGKWDRLSKRQTKEMFSQGDRVNVLVGTDTLAEGLNLQTCGRLVNYDLPWNFTRVEQRIGRIDRIGGHAKVEVTNLLYEGTVETTVYKKLVETFGGFNAVVGIAQPVLGQVEHVIQGASLTDLCDDHEQPTGTVSPTLFGDDQAELSLDDAVAKVIQAANDAAAKTLSKLDEHGSPVSGTFWDEAADLLELEQLVLDLPDVGSVLAPSPDQPGVYLLGADEHQRHVTFDRAVLAALSPDVELLSWGTPAMDLLTKLLGPPQPPTGAVPTIADNTSP